MFVGLEGKRAIVTGATRGIGKAIVTEFARAGARVVVSSNEPKECDDFANELVSQGFKAVSAPCDVAIDADLEQLVARTLETLGGVDILVCNAGVARHHGPAAGTSDQAYEETMRINARSPFKLCNLAAPLMANQRDGSIIIISSLAGLRGNQRDRGLCHEQGSQRATGAQSRRRVGADERPRERDFPRSRRNRLRETDFGRRR